MKTALSRAFPFGVTVACMIAVISLTSPFATAQNQTVMYLLLILISMGAVVKSCMPLNGLRLFICVTMVLGTFGALLLLPALFEVQGMNVLTVLYTVVGALLSALLAALLDQVRKRRLLFPEG